MIILGVDPGFDRVGWAFLSSDSSKIQILSCGCIQTDKSQMVQDRLLEIFSTLAKLIVQYRPTDIAIESIFFFKNAKTVIDVSQARGVIMLVGRQQGLVLHELTPLQVKSALTGDGHADKKSVEKMVRLQLSDVPQGIIDDTVDAIAIALAVLVRNPKLL